MKHYKVAILGATGAVGREMMKILEEREFPISELHLLASARSAGKILSWKGQDLTIEEASEEAFAGMDIVLGAAENDIARNLPRPLSAPALCLSTIPAPSVWIPRYLWWCRRSIQRTQSCTTASSPTPTARRLFP